MAAKRKRSVGQRSGGKPKKPLSLRPIEENSQQYELVFPRCARDRKEDLEEVQAMLAAEEYEVALDELRWLISECSSCLPAHRYLGELALLEEDLSLARGHFGYAYELGLSAIPSRDWQGKLPYEAENNTAFFEAGKGFAYCLQELGKAALAAEVLRRLIQLDPNDPLGCGAMLDSLAKNPAEQ